MKTASSGPAAAGHQVGDPAFRRISVALFAAGLATLALLYTPQPLLPELAAAFDVSAAQSTLSVSVCTLGLGAALLVVGPVSELVGRTPLMHASLFASSVVGLACALAPGWTALLVLRAVQGITLAGLPAVAMAYLREEVADESHARATGLYVGGTALGGMAGRLLSGGLADLGGWRGAPRGPPAWPSGAPRWGAGPAGCCRGAPPTSAAGGSPRPASARWDWPAR